MPVVCLLFLMVAVAGCRSPQQGDEGVAHPTRDISAVLKDHAAGWMQIPGVTMVAEGQTETGAPCLRIYVLELTPQLRGRLPDAVEGYPVEIEESGEIKPLGAGG
ncbi:hypothetical protein CO151_11415 [bacterium CG_4_9_14_3_um_filter_65_15]|nr:MAG: hypothetical protein CO151_11415 [bacterium CG_4_9_14_3_um_filter_65_15]